MLLLDAMEYKFGSLVRSYDRVVVKITSLWFVLDSILICFIVFKVKPIVPKTVWTHSFDVDE